MNETEKDALIRHVQGATVVHQSPFSTIEVPSVHDFLSKAEREKWVVPFYRVSFYKAESKLTSSLRAIYREITPELVERLLTDYNWRPRLTGAFFAGMKQFRSLEDQIGRLLLRSDLCFAGTHYCVALAEFNTRTGLDYLTKYLEYYLTRPELEYNQSDAMGAVAYIDAKNGTKHLDKVRPLWKTYTDAMQWKPDLDEEIAGFAEEVEALHICRAAAENVR